MNATMSLEEMKHYPVMLNQVLSIISPQHGGTFIDCTFGGGGYSKAILKFPGTKVLALDRDKLTFRYAEILVKKFPKRFNFYQEKFSNLNNLVDENLNNYNNSGSFRFINDNKNETQRLKIYSLDGLVKNKIINLSRNLIVKIDIEGYEFKALKGMEEMIK